MKKEGVVAVPRLLQIAGDTRYTSQARQHAIGAIGGMGKSAAAYGTQLIELKKQEPSLRVRGRCHAHGPRFRRCGAGAAE